MAEKSAEKSLDMNATDAAEFVGVMDKEEEIKAFIEGDERKTVLVAVEKRIAVLTTPPADKNPPDTKKDAPPVFAEQDTWVYHKDFEPKIAKKGEAIPEGWTLNAKSIVGKFWQIDALGKWSKIGGAS